MKQKEQMITISKEEYDSMKETLEILSDPDMMEQLKESEKNRKKGKFWKLKI